MLKAIPASTSRAPTVRASTSRALTARAPALLAAAVLTAIGLAAATAGAAPATGGMQCPAFLDHDFQKLHSTETLNVCKAYAGKPLLIVNTASHCGYTPQFKGLETLYEKYKDRGLVVVGFPSDDFNQESKDQAETAEVCFVNYGVKFTMLAPSAVKGSQANPVFKELNRQSHEPTWNFNKYLVSPDGKVVKYFDSDVTPDSPQLAQAVEKLLQ